MREQSRRKLAALLFADIVGYTALMQQDGQNASILLRHFQQQLETEVANHHGKIVNTYGDGALCTFEIPIDAIRCAMALQTTFSASPKVPVRIGVHSGTVTVEADKIYGDSVNITSRIESMGLAGAILFSKKVRDEIKNNKDLQLKSLGRFKFKHVEESMEVFALANNGFVVPKRREIKGKFKERTFNWVLPAIIGALLLSAYGIWQWTQTDAPTSTPTKELPIKIPTNSLAVLPLTNMSGNQENNYFTDGMHDDLLTHISKIGSMKVISRTSVLQFANTQKSIPEIATMLGVANILEGSVRLAGNQVRINVQLIKAETDEHIWSEIYDRELTANNIFDIQTEIAQKIAHALHTNISATQQVALEDRPTQNLQAYEAYLRGRQLVEERIGQSIIEAKKYLKQAIELDPNFAQAYVKLGEAYYLLVEYASEDSKTNYALAWEQCEKAKAINPNLAEVYGLECTLNHYDKGDIDKARQAYEKAISLNPNYADVYFWYSHAVIEIEKDFPKALSILENAVRLNPLSPKFINRMGHSLEATGQFDAAVKTFKKGIALAPEHIFLPRNLTFLYTHTSQLDSSAIIAYQTAQKHKNQGKYLRTYIFALTQLDMQAEIEAEMSQFSTNTRQDSLFYYRLQQDNALMQGRFDEAEKYLNQLMAVDKNAKRFDPTLVSNIYYYKRDFEKIVTVFEQTYPDVLDGNYFDNYMFSGYNRLLVLQERLQKYIYSLTQIGQQERAQQLLTTYEPHLVKNINPNGDLNWETNKRILFQVKNAILKGQHDLAMDKFEEFYSGKIMADWSYLLIDPIFDTFQEDPRYLNVLSDLQTKVAQQRKNFRMYLLKNG